MVVGILGRAWGTGAGYHVVMPGTTILGSGRYLPGAAVPNALLSRVMDTSDEWIKQRAGIEQRYFAPEGVGASDLALPACQAAIESAGLTPRDIDYVLFNTMTPDYVLPGPKTTDEMCGLGMIVSPPLGARLPCTAG